MLTDVRIVAANLLENGIKDVNELDLEVIPYCAGTMADAVNEKTRLQNVAVEFVDGNVGFRKFELEGTWFGLDDVCAGARKR